MAAEELFFFFSAATEAADVKHAATNLLREQLDHRDDGIEDDANDEDEEVEEDDYGESTTARHGCVLLPVKAYTRTHVSHTHTHTHTHHT